MRYCILLIITLVLGFADSAFAQPTTSDCIGSAPVCGSVSAPSLPNAGVGTAEINADLNCLRDGEKNSNWFTFTVSQGGQLCLTIYPDVAGDDYDWAIFDLTGSSCADIATDSTILVQCSFEGVPQGCDGNTGPNGDTLPPCGVQNRACLAVETGEHYALYISSFKQGQSEFFFEIDESQPNSAIITDTEPPAIDSVSVPIVCGVNEIEVTFSESVLCESVDAGDFTLHGPNGDIAIAGIVNAPCDLGSPKGKRFIFQTAQTIADAGSYSLELTGVIEDECNNVQDVGQSLEFEVDAFTFSYSTTPATCTSNDGSAVIAPNGGSLPYTYLWSNGANTSTASGINSQWHFVSVTDSIGCMKSDSLFVGKVDFNPTPFEVVTPAMCVGASDGAITIGATGGTEPYTYVWGPPLNTTGQNQTDLEVGNYPITITDVNGCDTLVSITVGAPKSDPIIASDDQEVCIDATVSVSASTVEDEANYRFYWIGFPDDSTSTLNTVISDSTSIGVYARHNSGCYTDSDYVFIDVLDSINGIISPKEATILKGDSAIFSVSTTGGNGQYEFTWIGFSPTASEIKISPEETADFVLEIEDGCTTPTFVDTFTVIVLNLLYPNTFTPQGDGLNETFCMLGLDDPDIDFSLRIYDRWGIEVWNAFDIAECWDGTWKDSNTPVPSATYRWRVRLIDESADIDEVLHGWVNVVR